MLDRDDCRGAQLCRAVSRKLHRVQHDRYAGRCVGHRAYEHHMVSHLLQFYYFIIFHKVIIFLLFILLFYHFIILLMLCSYRKISHDIPSI